MEARLLVELHDRHDVGLWPSRVPRLVVHGRGHHGGAAGYRGERERAAVALRADGSGRVHVVAARVAPLDAQHAVAARRPVGLGQRGEPRARPVRRVGAVAHGGTMTPSAASALTSLFESPRSTRISRVCSPTSGAPRDITTGSSWNCTGLDARRPVACVGWWGT